MGGSSVLLFAALLCLSYQAPPSPRNGVGSRRPTIGPAPTQGSALQGTSGGVMQPSAGAQPSNTQRPPLPQQPNPQQPNPQQPNPGPQQPQKGGCPRGDTVNAKGIFRWPNTRAGITVKVPCPNRQGFAVRACSAQGQVWGNPDTSACSYQSTISQGLGTLLSNVTGGAVHDPKNRKSAIMSLKSLTAAPADLTTQDLYLASSVIDDLLKFGPPDRDIADDLFSTASQLLGARRDSFRDRNKLSKISQSLWRGIEETAREYPLYDDAPFPVISQDNLIAEMFDIAPRNFRGYSFFESSSPNRYGRLSGVGKEEEFDDYRTGIELPESILSEFNDSDVRINVLIYDSADLFQDTDLPSGRVDNNTKVIGCFVGNKSVNNLTDPVKMVFTAYEAGYAPQCVYWDDDADDGYGGWSSDGCKLVQNNATSVICSCNHLTSFSVIFTLCEENCPCKAASDSALSIVSYVGCGLSMLGLFLTLVFLPIIKCCGKQRDLMANSTHIVFNFSLSLLLSLATFFTIRAATESEASCTAVALLLHFFLMSTFLWMLMEGVNMYRDFVIAIGVHTSSKTFLKIAYSLTWGLSAFLVLILLAIQLATRSSDVTSSLSSNATANDSSYSSGDDYFSGDYGVYDYDSQVESNSVPAATSPPSESSSGAVEIYGAINVFRDDDTLESDVSYCWIKHTGIFLGTFAVPALLICLFNMGIAVRIYFVLRRSGNLQKGMSKTSQGRTRVKAMILISSLLGLTWLLGVATLIDFQSFLPKATGPDSATCLLGISFHYLFAIFNSLQGFCVFLFYIVLNKQGRKQLGAACCPKRSQDLRRTRTMTTTSSGVSRTTMVSMDDFDTPKKNANGKV